jgi:hypothetical protein
MKLSLLYHPTQENLSSPCSQDFLSRPIKGQDSRYAIKYIIPSLKLIFTAFLIFIAGCASKNKDFGYDGEMLNDKYAVLENIKHSTPEICEYSGRIAFRYVDPENDVSHNAILRKTCDGNMIVRVLGPFGVTVAEMTVEYGIYTARRGGKDVTEAVVIPPEDMLLLQRYMRLPPPMPDSTFTMIINKGQYMFLRGEDVYYVSPGFKVVGFINPDHRVGFVWDDSGGLKTLIFSRYYTTLSIDFTYRWNITR